MESIRRAPFHIALLVLVAVLTAAGEAEYTLAIETGDLSQPNSFFAFNNRANAYAAKRDWEHALQDPLRRNPKFAAARRNRGLVYANAALVACPYALSGRVAAAAGRDCRLP
ncbi:MAG TPA: hypothetical protein VFW70_20690 [Methylomirabilota bacterium]|nr:hypothetical protein [Methylomirabilota bacterium]